MKKNEFLFAMETLQAGKPVLCATIIRQSGSSPRGKGARIFINGENQSAGSIGGGKLEEIVKKSFQEFIDTDHARVLEFSLSENEAESLEMICGGNVTVLVEPFLPQQIQLAEMISSIVASQDIQQNGWILSQVPSQNESIAVKTCFVFSGAEMVGNFHPHVKMEAGLLSAVGFDNDPAELFKVNANKMQEIQAGEETYVIEPIGRISQVIIIGAGHIAQKLAPLTRLVGFFTTVMDDRPEYITPERFPQADRRVILPDFENALENVEVEADCYLVIVTRGHSSDKSVLRQALQTKAGYIGMIGSRRKIALTYEALRKDGLREEDLAKIHAPIGLSIGAVTPEEIAISIVAELIEVRSKLNQEG